MDYNNAKDYDDEDGMEQTAKAELEFLKSLRPEPEPEPDAIQKFQDFWQGLNSNERHILYDVLTLLRGPDQNKDFLKEITTEKIRHLLFSGNSPVGYCAVSVDPITKSDLEKIGEIDMPNRTTSHFLRHVADAFEQLRKLGYIKESTKEGR